MKILITEEQYRLIEGHYVDLPTSNESEINEIGSSEQIMSIRDLSEMVGRMGYDKLGIQAIFEALIDCYRRDGDDGVMDCFKTFTGVDIVPISRGKYIFNYR